MYIKKVTYKFSNICGIYNILESSEYELEESFSKLPNVEVS